MSLWQFTAAIDGWMKSQGVESKPDMLGDDTIEEFDRMLADG